MSTPPPPYQQGPYQQSPYQQGPYPGPYQQGPYPVPGAWGPPPPPPKKNRTGMILGITAAGIAGLLLLSWIGNGGLRGGSGSAYPSATHRLELPKTLVDGRYTLAKDDSQSTEAGLAGASETVIRDPKGVLGQYTHAGEDGAGVLIVTGLYGRIKDPDTARRKILEGAAKDSGTTVLVPPKDVTPPGADTEITCQVLATEQSGGGRVTYPMCAWADDNTNAAVAEMSATPADATPDSLDLTKTARTTLTIRDETRRPLN